MKVCVYAICKNESKHVKRWVESMKEADEIYVLDTGSTDNTKELLQELAKNVRIFVTFGNHDTQDFDGKRWFVSENLSFWDDLSLVDNIYVANLPKEKPTITKWPLNDEVDVCALNLTTAHYLNKEPCEEFRDFLEMLESFDVNLKKFNILLCHSPMNIARSDVIDDFLSYLKQYNLILSGHIHAGFIPKCLRRNTWGGGLVGPYGILLPSYAYGLNEHNGVFTLTSGGAVKLADSSKPSLVKHSPLVDKMLRSVYPPEIEILRLRHGDANKIVKVLSKTH